MRLLVIRPEGVARLSKRVPVHVHTSIYNFSFNFVFFSATVCPNDAKLIFLIAEEGLSMENIMLITLTPQGRMDCQPYWIKGKKNWTSFYPTPLNKKK